MAAGAAANIFRTPGRLSYGATNLASPWPHGGTGLGIMRAKVLRPFRQSYVVRAEEFGMEPVERLELGFGWVLAAILRDYDADAVGAIFPNTSIGSSGRRVIKHPGTAGPLGSARSVAPLVFTPDDSAAVGFIMYRALPEVDEGAELSLALSANTEIACVFTGIRDASNRVIQIGRLSDLQL
jgi:hypothetical protein